MHWIIRNGNLYTKGDSRMKTKSIFYTIFSLVIFLGFSVQLRHKTEIKPKVDEIGLPKLDIQLGGLQELSAGTADSWGFVRQSATWGRGNSNLIDGLLSGLQKSGIFTRISSGEIIIPNQTSTTGVTFTYRLKINEGVTSVASTAYSGTKTFSHRFEAWVSGDTVPSLQMFFSSLTDTGTSGVLLYYNLSKLNPTAFGTATNAVVESYTSGAKGSMAQTYSWKDGPQDTSWISKNGRVIIREMNSGAEICVRTVVTLTRGSTGIGTNLDVLCGTTPTLVAPDNTSSQLYYLLAYVQKTASPFYTVAKSGLAKLESAPIKNIATFCGVNSGVYSALPANYGLFDSNGFVSDGATAGTIPTGYPSATDVDNAFSRTGAALGNTGSDAVTVAEYDQSDATFMDGLSANGSLAFKASTAPSCSQTFCIN